MVTDLVQLRVELLCSNCITYYIWVELHRMMEFGWCEASMFASFSAAFRHRCLGQVVLEKN